MALWSGRFEDDVDEFAHYFGASLEVDKMLSAHDVTGSIAHARMLAARGIISEDDAVAIEDGLREIAGQLARGTFPFDERDEDIHMAVERVLTDAIGSAGARLHTGRSRNDQVALDTRLIALDLSFQNMEAIANLCETLLSLSQAHKDVIMPGYTHLQHAQPVRFSHHMLAYFWMFARDFKRMGAAFQAANANPLGAAALAGTSYPIDREMVTDELGLERTVPNSLDAVSDRDYLLDLEYACSVCMMHLSRLCEEIVLWSTSEFGFIELPDTFSTGSSIMPQKKNPDFAELVRGKSGRVVGSLVSLLVTMKGLPLAYNKDMQECKEGAIDAGDTLCDCLCVVEGMLSEIGINAERMLEASAQGFTAATDVADYLARKGLPFRQAHEVAGKLVRECEKRGCGLEDLALEDFKAAHELFEEDILGTLDPRSVADARTSFGGTGAAAVEEQLALAEDELTYMISVVEPAQNA